MAIFAIGDMHLSLGTDKPMDVFGGAWTGYMDKLEQGLSIIGPEDTTVLCGDLSWGMDMDAAREDFRYISRIPGRKILLKGNHDYWWSTAKKFYAMCEAEGFRQMELLHNNCFFYGEIAICGTRGWFYEEERDGEHDKKIMLREIARLEASLNAAGNREKLVFLHYPPIYQKYQCPEILELLKKHGVRLCCYSHIHGKGCAYALNGWSGGTEYKLVSADFVDFSPIKLL